MLSFEIPTMSCGHCVRTITEAVRPVDPAADVKADLPAHRVDVLTSAPREALVAQLIAAGYTPS
jgi:copper chaperone